MDARRRFRCVVSASALLLGITIAVTSCRPASTTATGADVPSISPLAQEYARIDDTARLKDQAILTELKTQTALPTRRSTIAELAFTMRSFDGQISRLTFPNSLTVKVQNLTNSDSQLEAIAESLAQAPTVADFGDLFSTLPPVLSRQTAADNAVRATLGLPQASNPIGQ